MFHIGYIKLSIIVDKKNVRGSCEFSSVDIDNA